MSHTSRHVTHVTARENSADDAIIVLRCNPSSTKKEITYRDDLLGEDGALRLEEQDGPAEREHVELHPSDSIVIITGWRKHQAPATATATAAGTRTPRGMDAWFGFCQAEDEAVM